MVTLWEKLEKGGKSSLGELGNTSNAKRTLLSDISIAVKMVIEQKWLSTWIKSQSDKPIPTVTPPHATILDRLSAEPSHESRFIWDAIISIKVRTVKNTNPVKGQGALRYSRNSSHHCLNGSSERVLVFVSGHRLDKTGPLYVSGKAVRLSLGEWIIHWSQKTRSFEWFYWSLWGIFVSWCVLEWNSISFVIKCMEDWKIVLLDTWIQSNPIGFKCPLLLLPTS